MEGMASVLNLPVKQSVSIDTMLNFEGDGHGYGDGTCNRPLCTSVHSVQTATPTPAILPVLLSVSVKALHII